MARGGVPEDLLSIADLGDHLPAVIVRARELKRLRRSTKAPTSLARRSVAMVFEKPSTRTRISFEVGIRELGGTPVVLSKADLQLGRGETIADTARVMSRYVDAIVYRAFRHADEVELAHWASVPVVNALDDREHPCQVVADLLTLDERWESRFEGHRLAYIGDGNNVCNSLALGCALIGLDLTVATPRAYRPPRDLWDRALEFAKRSGAKLTAVDTPQDAAAGADAVYTDVWVSMGDEAQVREREAAFQGYQVNARLLALAAPAAVVLHDLPAHRGQEITDEVLDGPQSAAWDQAENRLHAQKAILELLMGLPKRSR
jgi:ornithine carbamoyltransferase